jgi:hypothetical protein
MTCKNGERQGKRMGNFKAPLASHPSGHTLDRHENIVVTMDTSHNSSWSHIDWCKVFIHLKRLNVLSFGVVEATGLKNMASR